MEKELGSSSSDPFDPYRLLEGISLSPEPISVMQFPHAAIPSLPTQHPGTQYDTRQRTPDDESRGKLRLGSASGGIGDSQWQPQASPPDNILGIMISEDEYAEEPVETSLVPRSLPQRANERDVHPGISYNFSPNTVARRKSLLDGIPGSSDGGS